jgi:hypothetical protein
MKKAAVLAGSLLTLAGNPSSALALPRLTDGPGDYFLMPLLGYLALIALPQALALIGRGLGWAGGRG